jgi:hypothetical protein
MTLLRSLCVLLLTLSLVGCGGSANTSSEGRGGGGSAADLSVKRVDAAELPKLDEYLPPLDEGRIEVAPPAGWNRMAKTASYLCSFTEAKGGRLPAIVVKVSEPTVEGFDNVNEENVAEFTQALQATLKEPLEDAVPMVIGSNAFARYVKAARVKNAAAEVQVLATIQNGRMYTVELQVIAKAILAHRDHAYAVGAGLKFPQAVESTPEPKAEEATPEAPAEASEEKATEEKATEAESN